ncbi:MAG: fumarylacetoacetase [Ignavibacteria bacterium]|jgi:fumarylacetoacetase|nr:fumarylacetoacetase [Ignavibacteria bacterium]
MKSFVPYNNDTYFPVQNIPFGVFRNGNEEHICTAIGDFILDLNLLEKNGYFSKTSFAGKKVFSKSRLNAFMSLEKPAWSEARKRIQEILGENNPELRDNEELRGKCLIPAADAEMVLPVEIGDYTDFYSSKEHASNVGEMFRGKENALMPNWLHIPIAYHGRSSSIIVSGKDVIRPKGQTRPNPDNPPVFGPCKQLDFELEMGFFIGRGNELGESINVDKAEEHIFGLALVNDWSARDIQAWEYQPLGPFLAKNFATSVSPWIVTLEALEPYRTEGPKFEKELLPYLRTEGNPTYDIKLDVKIQTEKMKEPFTICKSNYKYLYYNIRQHLAHHTVNGCNTRTGDMMASGTISGPGKPARGSMLELTWRGTEPIELPSGETRKFIEDGDTLIMNAYCEGSGFKIGFGEVKSKILPAKN